jgi:hypothetical protein
MTKAQFLEGYDKEFTNDCERVLVTLLRGLGPYRRSIYLIGGLTPRYLVKAKPPHVPPHAGTGDIDLVVNMDILADAAAYKTLEQNLKKMGFERGENQELIKVNWRWKARTESKKTVVLEILTYDPARDGRRMNELATAGNVTALNIPHADLVFDLHDKIDVTAQLLGENGRVTETVSHANRVSFTCLKAFAFDDRAERKDAHDLVYCLEYGDGGVEAAVAEFEAAAQGKHHETIRTALRRLHARFGDDDAEQAYRKDGPVAVAKFEIGDEVELVEQRALRQRDVAGVVGRFLAGLTPLWRDEPGP